MRDPGDRGVDVVGDLVHQPDPQRHLGREALARHEPAPRSRRPDLCERERRDHRRDDPEPHLAERELCFGLGNGDVATGDQPAAAAERVSLNSGHDRCGAAVDRVEHRTEAQRVGDVVLVREVDRRPHPFDIGTGRERLPVPAQQHRTCVSDVRERIRELGDERGVERVAALGARHRDVQQRAVALDPQRAHSNARPRCASSAADETVASRSKISTRSGSLPISSRAREGSSCSEAASDSQR